MFSLFLELDLQPYMSVVTKYCLLLGASAAAFACNAGLDPSNESQNPQGSSNGADGLNIDRVELILPEGTSSLVLLPARIRRLTNAEYDLSIQDLLGSTETPSSNFPPDTRQHGYTTNEAQRIDPVLARQLDSSAISLAEEATANLDLLAPCADSLGGAEACAQTFIDQFASRAFRRPLTPDERSGLFILYQAGALSAGYLEGIQLVIRGVLNSPNFLYITEIGDGTQANAISLTNHEIASQLSYLMTGGPPDDILLQAAAAGQLGDAAVRQEQARRLLGTPRGQNRSIELVREWLGVDRISTTAKDAMLFPEYVGLQGAMEQETKDFIRETLVSGGNVEDLLGAQWGVVSPELSAFYGASGSGRVELPNRVGLLNQAAFLSVYSHAQETAPVLRGVAIMRRLGCIDIEIPTTLEVEIIPPLPDPEKTTRERFAIHAADDACASCHTLIDPMGFSFEHFDAMGAPQTEDVGKPIDSTGDVKLGLGFDGFVQNSNELAAAIAQGQEVRACFARQLFRAQAAERDLVRESEDAFIQSWSQLIPEQQQSLTEVLVALAGQEIFSYRSEQ